MTKGYPHETVMCTLVGLKGNGYRIGEDGQVWLTVDGGELLVYAAALDELEDRGWVEITDDLRIVVTERGRYWCDKWCLKEFGTRNTSLCDGEKPQSPGSVGKDVSAAFNL